HSLISDNFDSELELQRQALAINTPLIATGYVAVVCKLVMGNRDGERGGQALAEVADSLQLRRGTLVLATDPSTPVVLWPVEPPADLESARQVVAAPPGQAASSAG